MCTRTFDYVQLDLLASYSPRNLCWSSYCSSENERVYRGGLSLRPLHAVWKLTARFTCSIFHSVRLFHITQGLSFVLVGTSCCEWRIVGCCAWCSSTRECVSGIIRPDFITRFMLQVWRKQNQQTHNVPVYAVAAVGRGRDAHQSWGHSYTRSQLKCA
jgi:hypothetical protein